MSRNQVFCTTGGTRVSSDILAGRVVKLDHTAVETDATLEAAGIAAYPAYASKRDTVTLHSFGKQISSLTAEDTSTWSVNDKLVCGADGKLVKPTAPGTYYVVAEFIRSEESSRAKFGLETITVRTLDPRSNTITVT